MSNESAVLDAVADQLRDIIDSIKRDIEPNRVTVPASWRKGGRYNNTYSSCSNQPVKSRPLPDAIQEKVDRALSAPSVFRAKFGISVHDPEGYEWWDECFWPIAELRRRVLNYREQMAGDQ